MPNYAQDTFQLIIGKNDVTKWVKSLKVESHLYGAASSFEASLQPYFSCDLVKRAYPYFIFINNKIIQNGYVDDFGVNGSIDNGWEVKVSGRDSIQILIDNDCMFDMVFTNKTIDGIFNQLLFGKGQIQSDGYGSYPAALIRKVYLNGSQNPPKTLEDDNGNEKDLFITQNYNFATNWGIRKTGASNTIQWADVLMHRIKLNYSDTAKKLLNYGTSSEWKFYAPKVQFGESLFDFFTKILNQMGLILRHTPSADNNPVSDIIFYVDTYLNPTNVSPGTFQISPSSSPPVFNNYLSNPSNSKNNVCSFQYLESIKEFYQFVKLIGNAAHEEDVYNPEGVPTPQLEEVPTPGGGTGSSQPSYLKIEALAFLKDPGPNVTSINIDQLEFHGLTKFRSTNSETVDANTWIYHSDRIINNFMITQVRNLYKLKYHMDGWAKWGTNSPYVYNELAIVNDEILSFPTTSMLISDVEYNYTSDGGHTTDVTLHNFFPFSSYGLRVTN